MSTDPITIDEFNDLPDPEARAHLSACCGAAAWVDQVLARLPYAAFDDVLIASDEAFATLAEGDWQQAFAAHPRIGQDAAALRGKFADTAAWASAEQSGVARATDDELAALADANRAYHDKFGYTFIVNATGKSARDMLELLLERMENTADEELPIAATEQMKITHVRLHKLFADAR